MSESNLIGCGAAPDAVRWRRWDRAALGQAAVEQKPILLAITTSWCEGCALMDRSSYGRADIAACINEQFVPIRIDADRRPDLNERYNLGGWPTTVFLTPEGEMLAGSTYIEADRLLAVLGEVAAAWRHRRAEILADSARARAGRRAERDAAAEPDLRAPDRLRELLLAMFDRRHGGFGHAPKAPHVAALRLGLDLFAETPDARLEEILRITLDRLVDLWDPVEGGFFRYAGAADWTQPATEKLLAEQAAMLHLFVDAAFILQTGTFREQAASLARWIRATLADEPDGGFFNAVAADRTYYSLESAAARAAQASPAIDRSMYVDGNAEMAAAFLRAAVLLEDHGLRDFALASLERVLLAGYRPGAGVAHVFEQGGAETRGLLGDQVRAASALIWAHAATDQLPYSMLAAELMHFAIRTMWDGHGFFDAAESSEDPVLMERARPLALNCEAACVLARLSTLTGSGDFFDRAMAVLKSQRAVYPRYGLAGAPYALAIREVVHGRVPSGLHLARVDWRLEEQQE